MTTSQQMDHLFRREYSKIVSSLTSRYTSEYIDLIEDAVQDALLKAMRVWSFQIIPQNPTAWLYRVAANSLIDQLRRNARSVSLNLPEDALVENPDAIIDFESNAVADEQLKMIFACCSPVLKPQEQLLLCLKLLCGLSVREIARGLLKSEAAIQKAFMRARQKFKQRIQILELPDSSSQKKRLLGVLKVIYMLFNEGYKATSGEQLIKKDLCDEAIRLALLLTDQPAYQISELYALLALMHFNVARFESRIGADGELVILQNQNRQTWDSELIHKGEIFFNSSAAGKRISEYHLEAAIARIHTTSETFEDTDWQAILFLYDNLFRINPSPVIALNRVVAVEKANGLEAARQAIGLLEGNEVLNKHHLFYAIKADLEQKAGNMEIARKAFHRAISLTDNAIEKQFLLNRLNSLECGMSIGLS